MLPVTQINHGSSAFETANLIPLCGCGADQTDNLPLPPQPPPSLFQCTCVRDITKFLIWSNQPF